MKIKKLQFNQIAGSNDKYKKYKITYIAPIGGFTCTGGNAYYQVIFSHYDPNQLWNSTLFVGVEGNQIGSFKSLEEAMIACQLDFENRIMSNIDIEE